MIKSSRVTGFYLEGAGGLLHDLKGFSVIHIRGAGVDAGVDAGGTVCPYAG